MDDNASNPIDYIDLANIPRDLNNGQLNYVLSLPAATYNRINAEGQIDAILQRHIRRLYGSNVEQRQDVAGVQCDICRQYCASVPHLNTHKLTSHTDRYTCLICYKTYSARNNLYKHMCSIHGNAEQRWHECDICHRRFTRKYILTTHIRTHTGEKPYECRICHKRFTQYGNLRRHFACTHTGQKPFKCDICNRLLTARYQLTAHMRTHTGETFNCDICNRLFTARHQLTTHMRTHTGEKPFKCDICNRLFTARNQLIGHKRTHTGEKPFGCDICNRRFIMHHHLKVHVRTHTGEKPFKCHICHERFTQYGTLGKHIARTHTEKKPYESYLP